MRYTSYCIPFGKSMENGVTVFLNLKDAYLPKAWKHYEGLICLYGGAVEESDEIQGQQLDTYNTRFANQIPEDLDLFLLKSRFAIKRELTEETGTWWETAKVKGTKLQLVNTYVFEENTVFLYTLKVDVGVMSFKALQASNTEAIPLPMTYQRFLRTKPGDYVPGVYEMIKQVFDTEKM